MDLVVPAGDVISVLGGCAKGSASCFRRCGSVLSFLEKNARSINIQREGNQSHGLRAFAIISRLLGEQEGLR